MSTEKPRSNGERKRGHAGLLKRRWLLLSAICLLAVGAGIVWMKTGKAQPNGSKQEQVATARNVPVIAVPAKKTDFSIYLTGLGSVIPLHTITVKSRVDGQLMDVRYREGQTVNAGDLLATIDPRPFEVQLTQAEGQLLRDEALLKNAQLDLKRYRLLWDQDSIPKQQLDTQEALVRQYEGMGIRDGLPSRNISLPIIEILRHLSGCL